jgi:hypothetical protein
MKDPVQPVQFTCNITHRVYRKMLYFNTFCIKPLQSIFMAVVWFTAFVFLILDILKYIEPTRIMHFCFLVVTVSIPMVIVNLEIKIRKNRKDEYFSKERTVVINQDGFRYNNKKNTIVDHWGDILMVYETRSLFIIYKDEKNIFPISKTGEPGEKIESARLYFKEKLGIRFSPYAGT